MSAAKKTTATATRCSFPAPVLRCAPGCWTKEPQLQARWQADRALRSHSGRAHPAGPVRLPRRAALRQRLDPPGAPAQQGAEGPRRARRDHGRATTSPFVPGWDCHGLPIEHKVMKELGDRAAPSLDPHRDPRRAASDVRREVHEAPGASRCSGCGTLADYEHPYLTMDPAYEGAVLEVFARAGRAGARLPRPASPVHWSIENQTALAEAELEYYDREDASVYVALRGRGPGGAAGGARRCRRATRSQPDDLDHDALDAAGEPGGRGRAERPTTASTGSSRTAASGCVVVADELAATVLRRRRRTPSVLGRCRRRASSSRPASRYRHPFIDRDERRSSRRTTSRSRTAPASCTPPRATAPRTTRPASREGLEIYCPVRERRHLRRHRARVAARASTSGRRTTLVIEHLREVGPPVPRRARSPTAIPHDWRGKTPMIFRATEQWFVARRPHVRRARASRCASWPSTPTETDDRVRPRVGPQPDARHARVATRLVHLAASDPGACRSPRSGRRDGELLLTAASVRAVARLRARARLRRVVRARRRPSCWRATTRRRTRTRRTAVRRPAALDDARRRATTSSTSGSSPARPGTRVHAPARSRLSRSTSTSRARDQHRGWFQLSLLPALGVDRAARRSRPC